jgi:quinol monooxygenase YgiN
MLAIEILPMGKPTKQEIDVRTLFSLATVLASVSLPGSGNGATNVLPSESIFCSVFELRQYTLHPGKRDDLVDLFEREFIESQEAVGMQLVGQFRDLDDPNRFVWIRGFQDMPSRADALTAFYGGSVWKTHREQANETMVDSDNVLLLLPFDPKRVPSLATRPPQNSVSESSASVVRITVYSLQLASADRFPAFFEKRLQPALIDAGVRTFMTFTTETAANNFPRLPIRERERVFVWIARFDNASVESAQLGRLAQSPAWQRAQTDLLPLLASTAQQLRLQPTPRSTLR